MVHALNGNLAKFRSLVQHRVELNPGQQMRRIIKQRSLEKSAQEVQLVVSKLGGEASALGAARMMAERIIDGLYRNWAVEGAEAASARASKPAKGRAARTVAVEDVVAAH